MNLPTMLSPMRHKRMASATKHYVGFTVKSIKQDNGGDIVIEGWANPAITDRETEVIPPEAWDIEEYEQNPVVLFNHGKDPNYGFLPIGKSIAVKVMEGGLWCRVVISNSEVPKIKAIRDLVSESILTTFSVGFDPGDEYQDGNGVNVVGHAKLLEISIVTIPMNPGAKFTLSSKDINAMSMSLKALRQKGAWVASAVQQRIYQLQQGHGDFNRDRALAEIGAQAGLRLDEVRSILAGEVTPVPTDAIAAFSKVLGMDEGQLTKLDKGDREVEKRQATAGGARQSGATEKGMTLPPLRPDGPADWAEVMERQPKESVDVPPQKKNQPGPDATASDTQDEEVKVDKDAVEDEDATDAGDEQEKDDQPLGTGEPETEPGDEEPTDEDDGDEPDVAVQAIVVPKDAVPELQDATTWVKDHGWNVDDVNQTEEAFYFVQTDPSAFDPDSFYLVDLGGGAWAQVGAKSDAEPYGTPPMDAQNEAKAAKEPEVPEGHPTKDGASAGTAAGPAAGAEAGDQSTQPFATPQGPGPWTSHKKPPKKKPAIHPGPQKGKGADPNADVQTGQPVDSEKLDEEGKKSDHVKSGTACASCMTVHLKQGMDDGTPHDQAVAAAINHCKDVCPTEPGPDGKAAYAPDQLRAFADGVRTSHEHAQGAGIFKAGHKSSAAAGRTKQGHMDESPTSQIGNGGSMDPAAGMDDNPYILAQKQTNVLLGALIAEVQAMSKKLDGAVHQEDSTQAPPPAAGQGAQMGMVPKDASRALANVRTYMRDLDGRLKQLGV